MSPWAARSAKRAAALPIGTGSGTPGSSIQPLPPRRRAPSLAGPRYGRPSGLRTPLRRGQAGDQVLAVHPGDELHSDLLGAGRLALVVVGAVAETLPVH